LFFINKTLFFQIDKNKVSKKIYIKQFVFCSNFCRIIDNQNLNRITLFFGFIAYIFFRSYPTSYSSKERDGMKLLFFLSFLKTIKRNGMYEITFFSFFFKKIKGPLGSLYFSFFSKKKENKGAFRFTLF
jgi:hypothetical protein